MVGSKNALSVALIVLSAAASTLAAALPELEKRKGRGGGGRTSYHYHYYGTGGSGNGQPLSKEAAIIVGAVIGGLVALVCIGCLIWFLWVKYDISDKIRDRMQDREFKRQQKELEKRRKEEPFVPEQLDPPSSAADQATLVAPPSPYSKSVEASESTVDLPPYEAKSEQEALNKSEMPIAARPKEIAMPTPTNIESHLDPDAPVPYTRELTPDPEGEKAGGWREKMPFLK
ncbi:hypothetical protein FRB90_001153 [Tulasnella sp. 427]|nr:hypothetical protein FRB90_001153 [Tulasnella sp. 427]